MCTILYFRLHVSLKQHLAGLREHLLVAMVPLGREDSVMSEGEVESALQVTGGGGGGGCLDRVMWAVLECVQHLCRASSSRAQGNEEVGFNWSRTVVILLCCVQAESSGEEGQDDSLRSRALALLDEMARRRRGDKESGQLQDTVDLLEAKCEELQDDLANARLVETGCVFSAYTPHCFLC